MNSRCYYQSLTKRAQHFILKNKDRSKREKLSEEGLPMKEKAKQILAGWFQKECRMGWILKQIKTVVEDRGCCVLLLMFCDNGTCSWHTASSVTVLSWDKQSNCVCVCADRLRVHTCIRLHERYSMQTCPGWFVNVNIQYVHMCVCVDGEIPLPEELQRRPLFRRVASVLRCNIEPSVLSLGKQ